VRPGDIAFNSDGRKMFIVGISGVDVNEYAVTTINQGKIHNARGHNSGVGRRRRRGCFFHNKADESSESVAEVRYG